jgi:zinc transport system permease protein
MDEVTFLEYLSYPFVRNALVAGVLISLCAALLGVPLVLRRLSFMGDGLSHVAFGAMAVAGVLNFADTMALSLPVTIAAALVLMRSGRGAKTGGDAMLAMLSVGAMAAGYLVMNLKPSSSNVSGDVCTTLFGSVSILTLTTLDMWLSVGLSVVVCVLWLFSYHRVFDMTFDESYARASGANATLFNTFAAVVVAVVIVISMRLVGTLLVSSLLVVPAIAAMRVAKSFRAVCIVAAVFTVVCSLVGIMVAVVAGTPVGSTIVASDIVAFLLVSITGRFLK